MKIAARHLKTHGILPVGFYCRYFPRLFSRLRLRFLSYRAPTRPPATRPSKNEIEAHVKNEVTHCYGFSLAGSHQTMHQVPSNLSQRMW